MIWKQVIVGALLTALSSTSVAQALGLTCGDVYSDAVANVEVGISDRTERSYYFNLYCEQNGSTRSFTNDGSVSFPIEGLPLSLTGSQTFSKEDLQNFCKIGAEQDYLKASDFTFNRYVVEDALKSYNDCRALELQKVLVTHRSTPPEGFTVFIEFRGVVSTGTLDLVGYDTSKMECTTAAFTNDGSSQVINGSVRHEIGKQNISIDCVRKPEATDNGEYYSGAEFRLSTSWGPYTISLPPNTRMGMDLVSQAEASHGEVVATYNDMKTSRDRWERRSRIFEGRFSTVRTFGVYQGAGLPTKGSIGEPCPQHGGTPLHVSKTSVFKSMCEAKGLDYLKHSYTGSVPGDPCGHNYFTLTCYKK